MSIRLYAFQGQEITDDAGTYLATARHNLEGKSVRWEPSDFQDNGRSIDFGNKEQAAKLTAALWRLHKQAGSNSPSTEWIV